VTVDTTVLTTVVAALGTGAVGNVIGKSQAVGGDTPWNKVLAPIGAILAPVLAKKLLGADLTSEQVIAIGVGATGLYSQGKNLYQFISGIFKKKEQ